MKCLGICIVSFWLVGLLTFRKLQYIVENGLFFGFVAAMRAQ